METLLRTRNGESPPEPQALPEPAPQAAEPKSYRWLKVTLIIADLVLVGLAAVLITRAHGNIGPLEVSACILAFLLGGCLTCWAFWLE